jgi:hypothetical protein
MLGIRSTTASIAAAIALTLGCWSQDKPVLQLSRLSEDQVEVYRAFLDRFSSLHFRNLASQTIPFDFEGFPEGRPCLNGIKLDNPSESLRTPHTLGPEITKGKELRLIYPPQHSSSSQYVALSEIAFDTSRQFAVLKYLFVCGQHCLSGATLVMEKMHGKWSVSSRRPCAMFVSKSRYRQLAFCRNPDCLASA